MGVRVLKRLEVRTLRRLGVVATSLTSSPEGRFRKLLQTYQIDTVLDVGANKVQFATMMRHEAGFEGTIVPFEPMKPEFIELRQRARKDQNWKVINCGLGDVEAEMPINVANNSHSSSLRSSSSRLFAAAPDAPYVDTQTVEIRTLDAVFNELQPKDSHLYLKIDAQGFKSRILAGAEHSLISD